MWRFRTTFVCFAQVMGLRIQILRRLIEARANPMEPHAPTWVSWHRRRSHARWGPGAVTSRLAIAHGCWLVGWRLHGPAM